tara:strand:- start:896 stop:1144 length:249 start_codon:yes stop_codon:yes gene_type:complete
MTNQLTTKENEVLNAICDAAIEYTGGDFTYADEITTDLNPQQLGGYITQLVQKGIIYVCDEEKQICGAFGYNLHDIKDNIKA